jgi:hypothetical protein
MVIIINVKNVLTNIIKNIGEKNIEYELDRSKKYYENNKDKKKEYAEKNKDKILKRAKKYWVDNEHKIKEKRKSYYINNKEKRTTQQKIYYNKRYKTDPVFRLKKNIQRGILKQLKANGYTKKSRTHQILGCTYEEFKKPYRIPMGIVDELG